CYLESGFHLGQHLYATERLGKNIAGTGEPGLIILRNWGAAKTDRDRRPLRPVGDFPGNDHCTRISLARYIHGHIKIDFLAPGEHRRGNRQRCGDGPGGGRIEQFGVELERTEIKAYAGHATSLKSRQYSFYEHGSVGKRSGGRGANWQPKCEAISLSLSHRERDSWRDAEWTQIQCNLNSPLIALSSAGLISLECATRTE